MNKRFHAQRLHVIQSLDALLYQLHTLSFFLCPSIWLYICRIISQFHCSRPRELDSSRSLRFFYAMTLFLNAPNLWNHSVRGATEGRAIILDFIGMSYLPSKLQLFTLDLSIIVLQLLLMTIAYETSICYGGPEADAEDRLLPDNHPTFSIPLFQASLNSSAHPASLQPSPTTPTDSKMEIVSHGHDLPLIIDLRFNSILTHLRHPPPLPPPPRTINSENVLPLPNTTAWPFPGMGILMRAGRQIRESGTGSGGREAVTRAGEARFPGGMDLAPG